MPNQATALQAEIETTEIPQTEAAEEPQSEDSESKTADTADAASIEDLPDESDSSTEAVVDNTSVEPAVEVIEQEQHLAHKAAVTVKKERARQDREARRKARQEAEEARQMAKSSLGERYHQAAAEVGRLRKEFLAALDDKARLLRVERVGEAVPNRSVEMESLDAEIKTVREHLDGLLARKRQMKMSTPELREVSERINQLRRERDAVRQEKKVAYEEAMAILGQNEG
jgi:hypothetical protein